MNDDNLSEKIRQILKELDLTQDEFAKKIGTSRTMISKWVTGESNITLTSLKKIAEAANKPLQFFFDESTNQNNTNPPIPNLTPNKDSRDIWTEIDFLKKETELLKTQIENLTLKIKLSNK